MRAGNATFRGEPRGDSGGDVLGSFSTRIGTGLLAPRQGFCGWWCRPADCTCAEPMAERSSSCAKTNGGVNVPASELGPEDVLGVILCGGAADFTSIHLPRILWCEYAAMTFSTASAPSGPGRKHTKPKPRDLPVAGSIITTVSDTVPNFPKWSERSAATALCGRPPTKTLFVPGTARFTSTLRPLTSCAPSFMAASAPVACAKVT
mmetsp:Transcript_97947/g.281782  ORF Transcript_97947/g.281782 Transcript_97947/m.281782 type:complete len:206 (-) Transcript_97947:299-916(-)